MYDIKLENIRWKLDEENESEDVEYASQTPVGTMATQNGQIMLMHNNLDGLAAVEEV